MRPVLLIAFFFSVLFSPWWFVAILGLLLVAYTRDYAAVMVGGVVLDILHGAPIKTLYGLSYLYTAVFLIAILTRVVLQKRLLD